MVVREGGGLGGGKRRRWVGGGRKGGQGGRDGGTGGWLEEAGRGSNKWDRDITASQQSDLSLQHSIYR